MPHGNRDYFASTPLQALYGSIDMAELAARLGSIVNFDRRGTVVWMDGFEEGFAQWGVADGGGVGTANISVESALSGGYSCKMAPAPPGNSYVQIFRSHRLILGSNLGLEFSFNPSEHVSGVHGRIELYDGEHHYLFSIIYDNSNHHIAVAKTGGGVYTLATNVNLYKQYGMWSTLKIVIDPNLMEYVRASYNDVTQRILGYKPLVTPDTTIPSIRISITVYNSAGAGTECTYVDNIILTSNE